MKKRIREIADTIIRNYNIKPIRIQFKQVGRGRARFGKRAITIPIWALERVREYAVWYIIHEIAHFICFDKIGHHGHLGAFREIEQEILIKYEIIPKYSRAYPKALYNTEGVKIYDRKDYDK